MHTGQQLITKGLHVQAESMGGCSQTLWWKHRRKLENFPENVGNQEAREEATLDYTLAMAYINGVD